MENTKITIKDARFVTKKNILLIIDGNIGCGKSTLLQYIKSRNDVEVVLEPINKWKNVEGQSLLHHV
uniref:Deoxynucleoside kinase domain-containing protein n=1 Tax=Megaselia scalaris TaxID=36166 RepID=T1GM14_MEGSC